MPEAPLPSISLSMGPYRERKIVVDSVTYELYTHKDHNYFVAYTDSIADTLGAVIRDLKQDYERTLELTYPYKKLLSSYFLTRVYMHCTRKWYNRKSYFYPKWV